MKRIIFLAFSFILSAFAFASENYISECSGLASPTSKIDKVTWEGKLNGSSVKVKQYDGNGKLVSESSVNSFGSPIYVAKTTYVAINPIDLENSVKENLEYVMAYYQQRDENLNQPSMLLACRLTRK